jgi:ABC-2 type transport system ATP-binding protein
MAAGSSVDGTAGSAGIEAVDLVREFKKGPRAVDGINLRVEPGEIYGFLGPNGAGKSTTVLMLTTLLPPTAGTAKVAGFDIVKEGPKVRSAIGAALQEAALDPLLTGNEHMRLQTALHGLGKAEREERGHELLERVGLTKAADRKVGGYSGGMKRRLDLALALAHQPRILFLDEPTTGLDPESRNELWDLLRQLVGGGTTVILTTQYLEEADVLADDIVLLDHGKIVATGTPTQLKAQHGGERVVVTVDDPEQLAAVARALEGVAAGAAEIDREELLVTAPASESTRLIEVVRALEDGGIDAHDVRRRESTLDDVFFSLTSPRARHGHIPTPVPNDNEEAAA